MSWLLIASLAHGWPTDDAWVPLTQGGTPMTDVVGDHSGLDDSGDLASGIDPVMSWYVDADDLYLRMQVRRSPQNGSSWFAPQDWAFLLETDGDPTTVETALMVHADVITTDVRTFQTNGAAGLSPAYSFTGQLGTIDDVDPPVRTVGSGTVHFIDVHLSRAAADSELGWTTVGLVRVAGANATAFTLGWDDVAACDNAVDPCTDLGPVLSDPIAVDQDEDGVVDPVEAIWGTDPLDGDTDDDGLPDAVDFDLDPLFDSDGDGLSDPLDPDSDDDGLLDGLEAGVSLLPADTDPGAWGAHPDSDPGSTTSPWLADTDGGGLDDGDEDWDGDGRKDFWETDPNDPSDDADTDGDGIPDLFDGQDAKGDVDDEDSDGDGIPDADEFLFDTDGDNVPDFLDEDSDNDGIPDAEEGDDDLDADGIPNYRDTDSDADGVGDIVEGADDLDGDGVPNYLDEDADGDGIYDVDEADEDGDGVLDDTDSDGIPDIFDNDLDSDGDGIPDEVEGFGDSDGDGTPDALDTDSDDDGMPDAEEADRDGDGVLDDTDGDGVPDYVDTDSDGDGIPDAQELDDEDCDGVLDAIDPVVDEGLCDTPTTTPTTDPGTTTPFTEDPDTNPFAKPGQFTGGSCSTSGSSGGLGLALLGLLALRRRRRAAAVAALGTLGTPALAQDINAQRLHPSVDGGPLLKVEDLRLPTGGASYGFGALAHYADDPFVYRPDDGSEPTDVLGSVGTMSLLAHYAVGAVRIGAELPVHVYADGFQVDGPVHLGDTRLSSKVRAIDTDGFDLGATLDVSLPPGDPDAYLGAGALVADGRLVAQLEAGDLLVAADIGGRNGTGSTFQDLTVSPAVVWGLGAAYALSEPTSVAVEIDGEGWLSNGGQAGNAPIEWLASVQQGIGAARLVLGGGSGLTRGVGAPDFRVLVGLTWSRGPQLFDEPDPTPAAVEPPPPAPGRLVVRVTDPKGAAVPGATVRVMGAEAPVSEVGPDGIVERELPAKAWEIAVSAEGYETANRMVDLAAGGSADLVLQLRPIAKPADDVVVDKESNRIYLNRKIFFELDKDELKVESLAVLDRLVEVLLENPDIGRIRIEGHTDSQGNDQHNLELSKARAASVKAYLVKQGVPAERLDAEGYGETRLLQQGDSEEVHSTNRRVEFHLLPAE